MHPLIEVCVEGLSGAKIAIDAGADRLELNSKLALDGLTPAFEDLVAVRQLTTIPLIAMLRPQPTSFVYDRATQLSMLRDLERLLASGADGVAVGGLNPLGEIDAALLAEVRRQSASKVIVMHRAFDRLRDQASGLEQLIDLGIDRVLTSGGAVTAEVGAEQLRQLRIQSRGRIEILPGAGIRATNALAILEITGCNQLHGTFKQDLPDRTLPDPVTIAQLRRLQISQ